MTLKTIGDGHDLLIYIVCITLSWATNKENEWDELLNRVFRPHEAHLLLKTLKTKSSRPMFLPYFYYKKEKTFKI